MRQLQAFIFAGQGLFIDSITECEDRRKQFAQAVAYEQDIDGQFLLFFVDGKPLLNEGSDFVAKHMGEDYFRMSMQEWLNP